MLARHIRLLYIHGLERKKFSSNFLLRGDASPQRLDRKNTTSESITTCHFVNAVQLQVRV